ncbi:Uncharacterised protein [Burkholderia pseudomallei]|nr:Uncharacterised protein [Burkholderia pseudomallei]
MRSGGSFSTCESLSRRYACIRSGAGASPGCGGEATGELAWASADRPSAGTAVAAAAAVPGGAAVAASKAAGATAAGGIASTRGAPDAAAARRAGTAACVPPEGDAAAPPPGAAAARGCRTTPSLCATMTCWPCACSPCAGKNTYSKPSSASTRRHVDESMPGEPGIRKSASSYIHQPSSSPNVTWLNSDLTLSSFRISRPPARSVAFTLRSARRTSRVACSTLVATATS